MFALAMTIEIAIASVGMVVMYCRQGNLLKAWQPKIARMKALLKDSWPLILSGIVISIYMGIDQIMLKEMVGDRSVGVYSAAVKISCLWYFAPAAIINSVYPSLVRSKESGEEFYYGRLQKLFDLMSLLAYAVAIPVTFLSPLIVSLLYGQKYAGAADILTIHIWTGVFVSLGLARETWLTTEGLMKFSAVTTSIGAAVNVVLNLWLIPLYEGTGAALATVAAQVFSAYLVGAFYTPTRRIFFSQTKAIFLINPLQRLWQLIKRNQA
jgi:PST family polysaccharide transporter